MIIILEDKPGDITIWLSDDWYLIEYDVSTRNSYMTILTEMERFRSGFNEAMPARSAIAFPQNWILA